MDDVRSEKLKIVERYLQALCLNPEIKGKTLKISNFSVRDILSRSYGEVTEPVTINYRTYRAVKGGLMDEKIFGPERNYECRCGKLTGIKFRGTICKKCGVEVNHSKVRRERAGHINLAYPIVHFHFQEHLADITNTDPKDLQKIIYSIADNAEERFKEVREKLRKQERGEWMIFDSIPVLPAGLRLIWYSEKYERWLSSGVNELYRRVICRNNMLKKLKELKAPGVMLRNERRMLQSSIDALFDNSNTDNPVHLEEGGEPLKSLTDFLVSELKTFWRKTCEYSGRAIVVYDTTMNEQECGLPANILLELYKPMVMHALKKQGVADTIKNAKSLIEKDSKRVIPVLGEVLPRRPLIITNNNKVVALNPIIKEGNVAYLHPRIYKSLGLAMKGEKVNYHLPLSEQAVREANQFLGRVIEGRGRIESGFSSLISEGHIRPLIEAAITGKKIQLSPLEQSLCLG